MWLLAGGVNYPVGQNPQLTMRLAPLPPESILLHRNLTPSARNALVKLSGWRFSQFLLRKPFVEGAPLPPLSDAFLEDFDTLLALFEARGLRLMPTLLSFEFFQPIEWQAGVPSGGRSALVFGNTFGTRFDSGPASGSGNTRDTSAQIERFFDATLDPLLSVAGSRRRGIHSIDVMNEPDWCAEDGPLHLRLGGDHPVTLIPKMVPSKLLSAFLLQGVERIVGAGFLSTIGFKLADPSWLDPSVRKRLIELGQSGHYLHQVHHYPSIYEPWKLKPHEELPITPCLVGEMPTTFGTPLGVHIAWWRERVRDLQRAGRKSQYLQRRIEICQELAYHGVLLWSLLSNDLASELGPSQRRQIALARKSWS